MWGLIFSKGRTIGRCSRSPSKEFSSPIRCRWYSDCTACNTTVNDSAELRAFPGGIERELLSRESGLHAKLLFCFPPFESIWVGKYKKKRFWGRWTTKIQDFLNAKLPQRLWSFHKDIPITAFPADSGCLCSPHEAQDFGLCLPVSQQSPLSTDRIHQIARGEDEKRF